ncbi:MAG TPA: nuclear transport factor 2 family protein [Dictyobacter sp.]|jgi:hypothetical protein|nr:nuclear transport factor 2 family protein [Dictyobacter sp.]
MANNMATVDMSTLRQAIEQRKADVLANMYDDNAQVQIISKDHQPSKPLELHGKQAISEFMTDICQRDMTHKVRDEVVSTDRISFTEDCQYPGGEHVLAASVLELRNGKIVRQVMVEAWDD